MKKQVIFTVCDDKNKWMLPIFTKSLRHWHTEEELPLVVYGQEELDKEKDENKFYKATPMFARRLIKEYDLVIKADVDQLITGNLKHILDNFDNYDVGVVYNINRSDPLRYGYIGYGTIQPAEYINCGLVAMRSEKFINHWWKLCNSDNFSRMQFGEQGFLNCLVYYGDYKVRFLDRWDPFHQIQAWNGLIAKGEGVHMVVRNGELWLPKGVDNYPDHDVRVVAYHWAGGGNEPKMNYRMHFPEPVIDWIDGVLLK